MTEARATAVAPRRPTVAVAVATTVRALLDWRSWSCHSFPVSLAHGEVGAEMVAVSSPARERAIVATATATPAATGAARREAFARRFT